MNTALRRQRAAWRLWHSSSASPGAIDMAKLAQKSAEHAEVRTLAGDVISAQRGEIATIKAAREDMHSMGMHEGGKWA